MNRKQFCLAVILILFLSPWIYSDSLWVPSFQGYLGTQASIQVGDVVMLQIDTSSSLSFDASSSDSKTLTLDYTGGEYGDLFAFLPTVQSRGNQRVQGSNEYSMNTVMAARVNQIDDGGRIQIQGTRVVGIEGKQERLTVSGWLDPADLGSERMVNLAQLSDAQLQFSTFLQPGRGQLLSDDIEEIIEEIASSAPGAATTGTTAVDGGTPGGQPGIETPSEPQIIRSYQLSDAKKRELFLIYVNRMIDLIFQ